MAPMNARLLRPLATVHPEAQNWATRVIANGGTFSTSTLAAVSTFCRDIDAAGIRDKFYRLNLFCGGGLEACLVPLYRAESRTASVRGNTTDTNTNFVSGDFNNTGSSAGLKGNGSNKHLNTGYPANTLAAANTHLAIGLLATETRSNLDATAVGAYNTTGTRIFMIDLRRPNVTAGAGQRLCGLGNYSTPQFFGDTGHTSSMAIGNIVATNGTQYRNGSATGTTVAVTDYNAAHSMYIFANNNSAGGGVAVNTTDARLGSYSLGAVLTAAQALAYSNALDAFNTTLSRT